MMNRTWRIKTNAVDTPFVPWVFAAAGLAATVMGGPVFGVVQVLRPIADGTLVDGGSYGPFDGVADAWDWTFNESSYEGSITLNRSPSSIPLEHRVVWEFSLSALTAPPPITARMILVIRGAPRFPAAPTEVNVYVYPADLLERPTDFNAGPAVLVGTFRVAPYQAPTRYELDVSWHVNESLRAGQRAVGFRFQVNPNSAEVSAQAFVDALDSDPDTKPALTIDLAAPGDADGDRDVDLDDFSVFSECHGGPRASMASECRTFDFDSDGDVDLADYAAFESYLSFFGP
jgi:hypothetical protein